MGVEPIPILYWDAAVGGVTLEVGGAEMREWWEGWESGAVGRRVLVADTVVPEVVVFCEPGSALDRVLLTVAEIGSCCVWLCCVEGWDDWCWCWW